MARANILRRLLILKVPKILYATSLWTDGVFHTKESYKPRRLLKYFFLISRVEYDKRGGDLDAELIKQPLMG